VRDALLVFGAYVLGSISWSYIVVRWVLAEDVRELGSGNAGATNVLRTTGALPAIAVLVLDVAKGVAPVVVGRRLGADAWVVGAAAMAVVLGHVYPLFLGFRGGKGVATAGGALGALAPIPGLLALAVFFLVASRSRYVSLASVVTAATYPLLVLLTAQLGWLPAEATAERDALVTAVAAIAVVVLWKHRGNLRRLRAGSEPRLGGRHE
jgi:acyl phosphate:glycerol-3-phosphate acyltransferase